MEESRNRDPAVLLTDENRAFGGAERHALTLARELQERGLLRALVARPNSWLAQNAGPLPFHPVGFRNEVDMLSVFSIYRRLTSSSANVLHCVGHRDLVASALARQLPGAPRAVLIKAEHSYPDAHLSPLFRWAYGQCDAITSVSEALARAVREALAPRDAVRHVVIPNGIEMPDSTAPPPPREGRPLHLGVLSPLRPGKGQSDFLRAAAGLERETLRISLAGGGEEEEKLRREASELGLEVEFLGHLEEPGRYLDSLDLSIVPSHRETFSLVTLESMVRGRAIVAAASEGVQELCRDYPAVLYPPGDVEALRKALADFCEEPVERAAEALRAAGAARQRFSSRRMADSYSDLYRELLEGR